MEEITSRDNSRKNHLSENNAEIIIYIYTFIALKFEFSEVIPLQYFRCSGRRVLRNIANITDLE